MAILDDFQKNIRIRVREFEEKRELEKKAEEYLQSGVNDGDEVYLQTK